MTAIYCRQSVDKQDSISIEAQEDFCKRELAGGEKYKTYIDKGYSGSNINRPNFEHMMNDIRCGVISKVVVYKLDRISRSILDFSSIIDEFEQRHIEFVSTTEKFDTSTPMGRAMLNIIMVFAQLERETIQKRVKDNFYERGKKGLFLAGVAPLGFRKEKAVIDGIKTHILIADEYYAEIVRTIYDKYIHENATLGTIVDWLNNNGVKTQNKKPFTTVSVRRILRNPVYVKANADVYIYLQSKGAKMNQSIEEYTGECGCTVYGTRKDKTTSKFSDYVGENVQLNTHKGLICASEWLMAQKKLDENKQVKNAGKGKNSWLSGLIKCGYCGLAVTVVNGQRNGKRYVNCGGRKQKHCYERKRSITFDELESVVENNLLEYISQYKFASVTKEAIDSRKSNELKIRLKLIDDEIENIVNKMLIANDTMASYLNRKIEELDNEKQFIINELALLDLTDKTINNEIIKDALANWHDFSLDKKKSIARLFIDSVYLTDDEIKINYLC